ncbi:MAG: hypothetical protein ACJ8LG_17895 [Massilia sp.]
MKVDLNLISEVFAGVEFFLACVSTDSAAEFSGAAAPALQITTKGGFWAVTSAATANGKGLVHDIGPATVLFRGYESELGVHSYSNADRLGQLAEPSRLNNGAFAYIKFNQNTGTAIVKSDAFGVAPLFHRQSGNSHFFASHPGLIHFPGDQADLTSWLSMLQNGHVLSDRSFYEGISRFPAGTQMTITAGDVRTERWFRFEDLPAGSEKIDDQAFQVVEDAYRNAMERCLKLDGESITVPFSSGFDSRRFFAFLQQKKVPFKAVTCQTFHRKKGKDYDIDSYFAPKIATAFGVDCELVTAATAEELKADTTRRQALIGTETFMHAWAVPLMRWLEKRPPSIVFDGLAGDTFGNSGFEIDGLHETHERDATLLVNETVKPHVFGQLSGVFPSVAAFTDQYKAYLNQFPGNLNQAELAFLQARTRRCISPWITMMHPPGHVIVFPYYDMEFVRATLAYHPAEKYKWFFQKECLKRFYPEYFDFEGSRNLPADHPPLAEAESRSRDAVAAHFAYGDFSTIAEALKYLSLKNKGLLLLSLLSRTLRERRDWLFRPLLLLVKTQRQARIFVDPGAARTAGR